jgi:hypothetical protein
VINDELGMVKVRWPSFFGRREGRKDGLKTGAILEEKAQKSQFKGSLAQMS